MFPIFPFARRLAWARAEAVEDCAGAEGVGSVGCCWVDVGVAVDVAG